jgi:hypothetical protein
MPTTKFAREEYHHIVVVLGRFNPSIFQPAWLSNKGLIGEKEGQQAKNLIIHNELAKIDLEWMELEVTPERFIIKSTQEPFFQLIRDLVINVFGILAETPIKAVGLNSIMHYRFENQELRDEFAWFVSPRNEWSKVLRDPRIWKTEMVEKREDRYPGHFRVSMEVSETLKEVGCKFAMNNHFEFDENDAKGTKELLKVLAECWEESIDRPKHLPEDLWKVFEKHAP